MNEFLENFKEEVKQILTERGGLEIVYPPIPLETFNKHGERTHTFHIRKASFIMNSEWGKIIAKMLASHFCRQINPDIFNIETVEWLESDDLSYKLYIKLRAVCRDDVLNFYLK